jgi:hypothetical protein
LQRQGRATPHVRPGGMMAHDVYPFQIRFRLVRRA